MPNLPKQAIAVASIIGLSIVVAVILFALRPAPEQQDVEQHSLIIDVAIAAKQALTINVSSQGTVQPRTETSLVTEVSGQVMDVSPKFENGGLVEQGEVLLRIDDRNYRAELKRAEAAVATAHSNLLQEKGRAAVAKEDLRKYPRRHASKEARALALRLPQLNEAKARLNSALADRRQAKINLDRTQIKAPYRGLIKMRQVDLGRLVEDVRQRFEVLAEEAGVAVTAELPETSVVAWVGRDLVDKVLGNLAANALRHSPAGSRILLSLSTDDDFARIRVEDEGPGVPLAHRGAIFERFVQLEGEGAAPGGTGLGLSLAKDLVELHGGAIGVEDGAVGACFWFTLPLGVAHFAPEEVDAEDGVVDAVPTMPARDFGLAGSRLLLVEDHPQLRAYLAEVLAEHFDVTTAEDGAEALELTHDHAFDVVVSDVMMPRMDGLELLSHLRQRARTADLPVLLVSARGELHDRVEGLGVADDYLPKPFHAPELVARVQALLRRARQGAHVPAPSPEVGLVVQLAAVAGPRLGERSFGAGALAKAMAMSPRTLQLKMQADGLPTPREWLRSVRIAKGRALLEAGEHGTVADVAEAVGMTRSYFSRVIRAATGQSPGELLQAGRDRMG